MHERSNIEPQQIRNIQKEKKSDPDFKRRRIIAVGGAKGGIGKSIFVANLGVLLSAKGRRTVLVDLDLGGANLHLYLGENSLRHTLNDFLSKEVPSLNAIMSQTKYGPYLIGGNSSQLGATNIPFARKLKLLRAIKKLEADYVILDLGGDTSYNVLDCFLAADCQLIFTTCDPASYLEAYSFLKVALYRKLDRLFGPESPYRNQKDSELESIIRDFVRSTNGVNGRSIGVLMQHIHANQPKNLALLKGVINSFLPQIVVNLTDEESIVERVVIRIQDVSQKMLGLQVGYLGGIPYQPEIHNSARDLVPVVARYPQGRFSTAIEKMLAGM